ncbi:Nramp family divalent metal transporter [Variovorax sp. J22P240]|uniref:Nramp family divalent metal transporter n=1 Tax=unclassified Variovorax TaxID=663243 RepID=UPI002577F278|nr:MULTISPECIES: Nramp family divalent metal transporter [unclassified Variovorax]MDL9999129.1 Nramp family divalent metal transporter [Variovorax sp. J22P240]MDM0052699.1 Nramp family divalent metal transporter [Variovorax sp. J22R115]
MSTPSTSAPGRTPQTSERWWSKLGPGLITGAADDDPSGIATYSQAGAQFGYGVGWTLLITYPLMMGIQLASARIGRVTGKNLTETFARFCPRWMVASLVLLLLVANVINLGADLSAMGASAALVLHGHGAWYAAGFGVVSLLLQVFMSYERYVRVLKWLTLSLFAYVGVVFAVDVDWGAAMRGVFAPSFQWSREYVTTVVAILGTTISPYLFFWQASQEVQDIKRVPEDRPLRVAPEQARRQLRRLRIDTAVGMGFSNLIAFFVITAAAATLHANGQTQIDSTEQAAAALRPIAGDAAFLLFALGIIGTGMLALPVLAGSAAEAVASYFHVRKGLDLTLAQGRSFYGILAAAMAIGVAVSVSGINPISALYWAAVINAVISVPVMAAVMIAASSRKVMREMVLPRKWKVLGWLATAAMATASVALGVVSVG